jgi:hypothetical protein
LKSDKKKRSLDLRWWLTVVLVCASATAAGFGIGFWLGQ